ncbi:MAG: hypothetical protein A2017_01025 [Lentisphaerae bacterium GWF2_44_16]|nr:MAG: hypothetical protein A2017_01025 [Lentisphaerae bacterium GWF2_44_16]
MKLENVTLEMSLKPFWNPERENCRKICMEMFRQWEPLCRHSDKVSVMLWIGDGSEILDYRGKPEDKYDWARYIGCINREPDEERLKLDPECRQLHTKGRLYRDDAPDFDYRFLKDLIKIIKETGKEYLKKEILLGATFDPGPEFAKSSFKYQRHPEVCTGTFGGPKKDVVSCSAVLKKDNFSYAGFPSGIPEGTPFGLFLGRQSKCFLSDLDFDFIWFSNGFGFGISPWNHTGLLFDGKKYFPEKAPAAVKEMLEFWNLFKNECPYPVYVRGTNMSTGIDIASDGVPLKELYEGGFMAIPPVNSPWAAINEDFGLELAGWMSHIAELPEKSFCFRFYTHDPWWVNSPWLDRYEREPGDIYLPMAVSRIEKNGQVQAASSVNFLTIDDSWGNMPEQVPSEVIPHLMEAFRHAADEPGPLVWIYPFEEYHKWINQRIDEVMFGDLLIRDAINRGLPLNTVCSVKNFIENKKRDDAFLSNRILISPVPEDGSEWEKALFRHLEAGGNVFIYGPLRHAGKKLKEALGIKLDKGLDGKMLMELNEGIKDLIENLAPHWDFEHNPVLSAGGIEETGGENVLASSGNNKEKRTYAAEVSFGKGRLVWLRGSATMFCAYNPPEKIAEHQTLPSEAEQFYPERLFPVLLERFGWRFVFHRGGERQREPVMTLNRSKNAFYFSGLNRNTFVEIEFAASFGGPLITGQEQRVKNSSSFYRFSRTWHHEFRIFARQKNESIVSCRENNVRLHGIKRSLRLNGLDEAELIIFPDAEKNPSVLLNPKSPYVNGKFAEVKLVEENGWKFFKTTKKVSGRVLIYW